MAQRNQGDTLRRVAQQLLLLANEGGPSEPGGSSAQREPNRQGSAMAEFNCTFRPKSSAQYLLAPPKPKGRKFTGGANKMASTTIKFVCLAQRGRSKPPSSMSERALLSNNGLGPASITFNQEGDSAHFHRKVIETYPALQAAGGYEVMLYERGGVNQGFHPVTPPYIPRRIKDIVQQAPCYLMPLQRDIVLEEQFDNHGASTEDDGPSVKCITCSESFGMHYIIDHRKRCAEMDGNSSQPKQPCYSQTLLTGVNNAEDDEKVTADVQLTYEGSSCSSGSGKGDGKGTADVQLIYERPSCSSGSGKGDTASENLDTLKKMFPAEMVTHERLTKALTSADNDLTKAIDIILDDDSDLDQSVFDHSASASKEDESPLDIMEGFRDITKKRGTEYIQYTRMYPSKLQQLMRIYKNPNTDIRKSPNIQFTGELAADAGGPSREYFQINIENLFLVDNLAGFSLFIGERGHYIPLCNMTAITSGCFLMVGKLLAHSVLHGGPGLPGLAPAIAKYLMTGSVGDSEPLAEVKDLPDVELKTIIEEKLTNGSTKDLSDRERDKLEELMVRHGFSDLPLTDANKPLGIHCIVVGEVLVSRTKALDAIIDGMNCISLGSLARSKPSLRKVLFPTPSEINIDTDFLMKKMILDPKEKLDTAEKTRAHEWFLQFIQEYTWLIGVVMFMTGGSVLCEDDELKIAFQINPAEDRTMLEADTCFNTISLPLVHKSYESFKRSCVCSIENGSQGFGKF